MVETTCRSSFDGKPWRCGCGFTNNPTKHKFFNLPAFQCGKCEAELTLDFSFCLGHIEAGGKSLVGEVLDQDQEPLCVPYAYAKAAEITERVFNIKNEMDPDKVKSFNPLELQLRFEEKFPGVPSNSLTLNPGLHKVLHMGLILRSEGMRRNGSDERYIAADVSAIPRDDFKQICQSVAEGVPFVATYLAGKRRSRLPYCKTYKSARPKQYKKKGAARIGHAVVIIGAGMKKGRKFFYFMNSWGKKFCPRKNRNGDIVTGGIGKLKMEDLTKNVIKLSAPNETGGVRRLQDQTMLDITHLNYILMTAPKRRCCPERLLKMQEDNTAEVEADIIDDGIFEDDTGGHLQNYSVVSQRCGSGITRHGWVRLLGTLFPWKKCLGQLPPHYPQQSWLSVPPTHAQNAPSHDPGMQIPKDSKMTNQKVHRYETHPAVELDEKNLTVPKKKDPRHRMLQQSTTQLNKWWRIARSMSMA